MCGVGNSLVGSTPDLLRQGIPNDAYTPVSGDSKQVATAIKKNNREQLKNQTLARWTDPASGKGVSLHMNLPISLNVGKMTPKR